jgi:GNAT superfamily N-acetyltransferase
VQSSFGSFQIDNDLSRIDFDVVHSWLTSSYWSPGVDRGKVERAAQNSADVVGVYDGDRQIGYCRIVSDKETFAWLADVFVDPEFRGRGVAKAMVTFALNLPYGQDLRRWVLATRDAHALYASCGFKPMETTGSWMCIQPRNSPEPAVVS